jgi:enoyl-CoA hydratase
MAPSVSWELRKSTAVITLDDGKANALSPELIAAVNLALDEIEALGPACQAVVISGRPGIFSGGFDLKVIRGTGRPAINALAVSGGELVCRLFGSSRPVVCACTGHAVAAGALVVLGSHYRVGAEGNFRIGLTETALGMVLPEWAVIIAEQRLARPQLQQAVVEARVYDPAQAVAAGFLDRIAGPEDVLDVAIGEAARLGALDPLAYAANARRLRQPAVDRLTASLAKNRARI